MSVNSHVSASKVSLRFGFGDRWETLKDSNCFI